VGLHHRRHGQQEGEPHHSRGHEADERRGSVVGAVATVGVVATAVAGVRAVSRLVAEHPHAHDEIEQEPEKREERYQIEVLHRYSTGAAEPAKNVTPGFVSGWIL
jgi:hypothetical protein